MNIKGSGTTNAGKIRRPVRKASASPSVRPSCRSSQVTPTELSRWIKKARNLPDVRQDLVERVKAEIADGTYETPEKIQIAVERMLEEIC
jgi:negative regulator of flagellin synthesis FlgM